MRHHACAGAQGNVVTAAGPQYAREFAEAILALLRRRLPATAQT